MWTTDTQFYSENSAYTPLMTQQFQWVIDNFDTMKSKMFLNTGDLVNVANNREQWERINAAYKPIEAAGIPFSVINGNHDLQSGTAVNANYREFFPASRMAASNPYWGGTSGDNYYYLMEENGAKFILLGMGMKWTSTDIEWADNVLKTYSDHFAILMVHDYLTVAGDVELNSSYTNVKMLHDSLIAKNDNIGLVLCGHNHGANTNLEYFGNRPVYSILADYQSLPQGGLGYMRMLKFDVENNLIYVNTYSAYQDSTAYFKDKQTDKSGLYQINKDEFVIQTDFGGTTTRTLATSALKMMADTTVQIGETQQMVGPGTVSVRWDNLMAGETYTWFAILTDEAGNSTKTQPQSFATEAHIHSAVKAEGRDATCTKDGNIPYWYCEDCNQYFKDEALTETITKEQTVISATGHHNLVEDKGHAATCTEDGLTDGKHCTQCDYKVEQAVIPATGHTYKDGKCTECGAIDPDYKQPVEQSKPQSPQTGDNSNIILWISFMLAAGAGLTSAAGVYFRKRKQEG